MLHKLIIGEIAERHKLELYQAVEFIKKNPDSLTNLKTYHVMDEVESWGNLTIGDITHKHFTLAREFIREYNILSNDALHLATMKEHNISNIASNDKDFERIEWTKLYIPSKI